MIYRRIDKSLRGFIYSSVCFFISHMFISNYPVKYINY